MTPVIHLGPLALAGDRLLAVAALWLFVVLGSLRWFSGARRGAVLFSAIAGLIAARLTHVVASWPSYLSEPLAALAVWEGGFVPLAGIIVAAVILVWRVEPQSLPRVMALLAVLSVASFAVERVSATSVASPFSQPNLVLQTIEGSAFDAAAMTRGRPTIVNLWADWCPPCRREMPYFAQAAKAHPEVTFLLVNQGDSAGVARTLPAANGLPVRSIVLDPAARLSAAYGGALPTTIFIAADGTVLSVTTGAISRASLMNRIDQIKESQS